MYFHQLTRRDRFEHGVNSIHHWYVSLETIVARPKNNDCNWACLKILLMPNIRVPCQKRVKLPCRRIEQLAIQ